MLRTSCVHPKLSAFHVLEGQHDYNRVPFGPPGTRATIINPPELRTSWGPRALDAWYAGPSWLHYRCMHFQIPSTGGYRTSAQYKLYPQHIGVPQETPMDRAVKIAATLTQAIQAIMKMPTSNAGRHTQALERLAQIFTQTTERLEARHSAQPQTSSTPTTPANIYKTPRAHSRITRNNVPGIIPQQTTKRVQFEGSEQMTEGEKRTSEGEQSHPNQVRGNGKRKPRKAMPRQRDKRDSTPIASLQEPVT